MPAVNMSAPLNPVPVRQAEGAHVILAAIISPCGRHSTGLFLSDPSRPLAAIPSCQSREATERPVPGTNSSPPPFPAGSVLIPL
jgi:hypothetical protein